MIRKIIKSWLLLLTLIPALVFAGSGVTTPSVTGSNGAAVVGYTATGSGAVASTVKKKLGETVSVKDFGAVGDGVTNDTAAFTAARAASGNGKYIIPPGTYLVDVAPDVWSDTFSAPRTGTALKIGGTIYDISGAFGSGWRNYSNTQRYLTWQHARTGKTIAIWSDGENASDSNRVFLPWDIRRDSHFLIASPETVGGATDLLLRRSQANADSGGNRFSATFDEGADRLLMSYATTASGAPSFDSAYIINAGVAPSLIFPALQVQMQQGFALQTRALGALKYTWTPGATAHTITDATSGNVLGSVTRSKHAFAGINFNTLLDPVSYKDGPQNWGGSFGDLVSGAALPVTKNIYNISGATRNQVIGRLMVAAQPSGAAGSYREARILFDGTTVTLTDLVNTLPAQIVATVALVGNDLQFSAAYTGGLGAGCTVTVAIEWLGAGR